MKGMTEFIKAHEKNWKTLRLIMKSFYGGSRGAVFSKRAPLAAGGKG